MAEVMLAPRFTVGRVGAVNARVVAVVVTWNRRELLEESLAALASQTLAADAGGRRRQRLRRRHLRAARRSATRHLDVVHLTRNTGGAGGFAAGIERALTHDPDLVWLLDDDTVPTADRRRGAGAGLDDPPRPGRQPARGARQQGGLDRRA